MKPSTFLRAEKTSPLQADFVLVTACYSRFRSLECKQACIFLSRKSAVRRNARTPTAAADNEVLNHASDESIS
jgi:hypothetical protein